VANDRQVVRDEQVGEIELRLEIFQQVQDLRLDRDVERGHGLVAHDQLRAERERPRDPDPLTLATGELVREAVVMLGVQPHQLHQLWTVAFSLPDRRPVDRERIGDDRADAPPRLGV
jgi:hypothetical protein